MKGMSPTTTTNSNDGATPADDDRRYQIFGRGASEEVKYFMNCFLPYISKTIDSKLILRREWNKILSRYSDDDVNSVSVSDLESWIQCKLEEKNDSTLYPNKIEGTTPKKLFDHFRPAYVCAIDDAMNDKGYILDVITYDIFGLIISYICVYALLYDAYITLFKDSKKQDSSGQQQEEINGKEEAVEKDALLSLETLLKSYKSVTSHGILELSKLAIETTNTSSSLFSTDEVASSTLSCSDNSQQDCGVENSATDVTTTDDVIKASITHFFNKCSTNLDDISNDNNDNDVDSNTSVDHDDNNDDNDNGSNDNDNNNKANNDTDKASINFHQWCTFLKKSEIDSKTNIGSLLLSFQTDNFVKATITQLEKRLSTQDVSSTIQKLGTINAPVGSSTRHDDSDIKYYFNTRTVKTKVSTLEHHRQQQQTNNQELERREQYGKEEQNNPTIISVKDEIIKYSSPSRKNNYNNSYKSITLKKEFDEIHESMNSIANFRSAGTVNSSSHKNIDINNNNDKPSPSKQDKKSVNHKSITFKEEYDEINESINSIATIASASAEQHSINYIHIETKNSPLKSTLNKQNNDNMSYKRTTVKDEFDEINESINTLATATTTSTTHSSSNYINVDNNNNNNYTGGNNHMLSSSTTTSNTVFNDKDEKEDTPSQNDIDTHTNPLNNDAFSKNNEERSNIINNNENSKALNNNILTISQQMNDNNDHNNNNSSVKEIPQRSTSSPSSTQRLFYDIKSWAFSSSNKSPTTSNSLFLISTIGSGICISIFCTFYLLKNSNNNYQTYSSSKAIKFGRM